MSKFSVTKLCFLAACASWVLCACGDGSCPDGFVREAGACVLDTTTPDAMIDAPGADGGDDTPQFEIISMLPLEGAADIEPGVQIRAQFSAPVDEETLPDAVHVNHDDAEVPGVVSYDTATQTVLFDPDSLLRLGEEYSVTIDATIRDAGGTRLAASTVWTFRIRAGQWTTPVRLDSSSSTPEVLDIAVHPSGVALVAWTQGDVSYVAQYDPASEAWSADPLDSNAETAATPVMAFDPSSNAWAVWARDAQVLGSRYTSGTFSPAEPVGTDAMGRPALASDVDANAWVVWPGMNTRAARYLRGRSWQSPQSIGEGSDFVDVAVDGAGEAVAIWGPADSMDSRGGVLTAATRGGAWLSAETRDAAGRRPQIEYDGVGFVAAWRIVNELWVSRRIGDAWTTPEMLTDDARSFSLGTASEPILVWMDGSSSIHAASFGPDGWTTSDHIGTAAPASLAWLGTNRLGDISVAYASGDAFVIVGNDSGWTAPERIATGPVESVVVGVDDIGRRVVAYLAGGQVSARVFR